VRHDSIKDMIDYNLSTGGLSRRKFGALTLGMSVVSALPAIAGAAETKESEVEIKTPDGTADAYFVHPAAGKHPGVLIWPDIFGLRPTFRQMGKRLAESGYAVLVVNPFYRTKKAPTASRSPDFSDPPTRQMLMSLHDSFESNDGQDRCEGVRLLLGRPDRCGQEAQNGHDRFIAWAARWCLRLLLHP